MQSVVQSTVTVTQNVNKKTIGTRVKIIGTVPTRDDIITLIL